MLEEPTNSDGQSVGPDTELGIENGGGNSSEHKRL